MEIPFPFWLYKRVFVVYIFVVCILLFYDAKIDNLPVNAYFFASFIIKILSQPV